MDEKSKGRKDVKKKPSREYTTAELWGYREPTPSELRLAGAFKKAGIEFDTEVPIKQFTCGFLINDWLIVEVDGETHVISSRLEDDDKRQKILEESGFTVMRVRAMDILYESGLKKCVAKIERMLAKGPPGTEKVGFEPVRREIAAKAKRQGVKEQEKRARKAAKHYNLDSTTVAADSDSCESMEDYFGEDDVDFATLLEQYDWTEIPEKDDQERRKD